MTSSRRPASSNLTFAALLLVAACESATGPGARAIAVNQIVEGELRRAGTAHYVLRMQEGQHFSVLLQVVSGAVTLTLSGADGKTPLASLEGDADGTALGARATGLIAVSAAETFRIAVAGRGTYRLQAYVADPAPERIPPTIAVGDTVAGEDIHAPADVDEFTFTGTRGDELIAYVQATDTLAEGQVTLRIRGGGLDPEGVRAASTGAARALEPQRTGRFTLPADGDYTLSITTDAGGFAGKYAGPYRFQVRRVDRRPEHLPQAAVVGDTTIGEALDYVGDVDEFIIAGTPGDEYNVLFRVTSGRSTDVMLLEIADAEPTGFEPPSVRSTGVDSLLTDRGSGRFTLPANGRATVRVAAQNQGLTRGTYQLYVHRVDRRPEASAPTLALGDSVLSEQIELPGDVDEYAVTVRAGTRVNVLLEVDRASKWAENGLYDLGAAVVTAIDGEPVGGTRWLPGSPSWSAMSGVFILPAGQYRLRVREIDERMRPFYGAYRVFLYEVRQAPERVPAAIAIGDTVWEPLDPPGDMDVFTFDGARGDHLDVLFQGMGAPTDEGFVLQVEHTADPRWGASVGTPTASPALDTYRMGRITLPATGRYRVTVAGMNSGTVSDERGLYRFAIVRYDATPEHRAPTIAIGETVSNEGIDAPKDVDEYTLRGAPGAEVALFVTAAQGSLHMLLEPLDPATKDTIRTTLSYGATATTGRVALPASGELLVRVSGFEQVGDYRLEAVHIDRAPEHATATLALGDTVLGEAVDFHGDVDEFRLAATAGQRVAVYFQAPNSVEGFDGLVVELVEPGTGRVLASAVAESRTERLEDIGSGPVVLPVTGEYVVRVRGGDDRFGRGNYRFTVSLLP